LNTTEENSEELDKTIKKINAVVKNVINQMKIDENYTRPIKREDYIDRDRRVRFFLILKIFLLISNSL